MTGHKSFRAAYGWTGKEDRAVQDVLHHGSLFRYYGLGTPKYVDALEEAARKYYGVKYALGLNSGTGALMAAMSALEIGPGCEVIVPAFLWVATVASVVHQNAIPVLCEVDDSLSMDPADLERQITPRTRLIVPIHMAGTPCDMDAIMDVANRHGIPVLEDCRQCNGGTYHGRPLGSIGRMGIFSLQLNKNITSGEGGLLITDDERVYYRAFSAHDMGMIRVNGRLAMPEPYAVAWGEGRRMTELCGAVASVQMAKLDRSSAQCGGRNAGSRRCSRACRAWLPQNERRRRRCRGVSRHAHGHRGAGRRRRPAHEDGRVAQRVPRRRLRAPHVLQHSRPGRQSAALARRKPLEPSRKRQKRV